MTVVTRFAPSPTGFLHIGGARTALFNWLFARHHGGKYYLRIEDTDRERSTQAAIEAIIDGLKWLGLEWDGAVVFQRARAERHAEIAYELMKRGAAYYCYCSPEEVEAMREKARAENKPPRYDGRCRALHPDQVPKGRNPVVRLRVPTTGVQTVHDLVQGSVTVAYEQLDDLILLRADGTPTYMLSVVVDDHDMGITHIIRGDDHLTNTFRQKIIYEAMGWTAPQFAHIPLIHGPDGAKLSKRHGALGVEAYREMGFLPEALCNYLARLGWSHGNDEIFSREQAIKWFDLAQVGRSAARFDMVKLTNLNAYYLRHADNLRLLKLIEEMQGHAFTTDVQERLLNGMEGLKQRAKTLIELRDNASIYTYQRPLPLDDQASRLLDSTARAHLRQILPVLEEIIEKEWRANIIETKLRQFSEAQGLKFGAIAQPLRAALTGKSVSPSIFEILEVLGPQESLARIQDVVL
jgi:glutamyl-tRNA synthetase